MRGGINLRGDIGQPGLAHSKHPKVYPGCDKTVLKCAYLYSDPAHGPLGGPSGGVGSISHDWDGKTPPRDVEVPPGRP